MASAATTKEFQTEEPVAEANTTYHDEPVATEPLQRVGTVRELNTEKQVDKDYIREKYGSDQDEASGSGDADGSVITDSDEGEPTHQIQRVDSRVQTNKWRRWLSLRSSHIPPIPKEREVSRETHANLLSIYSFQWMQPLMNVGYQRPLELNDLWLVNPKRRADVMAEKLHASFKRRVARGDKKPLLGAMHETYKFEFWLGGVCQFVVSIVQVINPFILRYIITFAGEAYYAQLDGTPGPNVGHGVGLVVAVTVLQMIQSGCTNQFLYRGMINGGQARAALMSLIFDKSMKISGRARAGGKVPGQGSDELPVGVVPGSEEERSWLKRHLPKRKKDGKKKGKSAKKDDETGWGNGRIVNLMSVDTYRIDQASGMFHMIWTSPISILVTLVLLLINISYSALAGFALIFLMMPLLGRAIKSLFVRRKEINKVTDQRVSLTQEILQAVRFVKCKFKARGSLPRVTLMPVL